jgi:hypothetical protein
MPARLMVIDCGDWIRESGAGIYGEFPMCVTSAAGMVATSSSAHTRRNIMAPTTTTSPERSARSMTVEPDRSARLVSTGPDRTARSVEDADMEIATRVQAALDQQALSPEIAEVRNWWDVAAFGPVQLIAPGGPLLPHRVVKVGEEVLVYAIILLNPAQSLPIGTNAADVLSNFALPYEVQFQTGNLTTWTLAPANMQAVETGNLVPGQQFYVERIRFTARQPGLYEMNITARLLGATPPYQNAPQFAGYATTVFGLDGPDLFGTTPSGPLRFQVYA